MTDDQDITEVAPTFRSGVGVPATAVPVQLPNAGQRLGDFELLRLLGQGSFGKVFLARQISLDREVALKVSANWGAEARTLAQLEHDHIVQVFSESVVSDYRLLCMQYVPGTTLERVVHGLKDRAESDWNGAAMLDVIDALSSQPALLRPGALRGREQLAVDDHVQLVCRLGTQLAEALDYAHRRGILHRDIKPANILINQYGRPLLSDFNVSCRQDMLGRGDGTAAERPGGTLAYMAPEHLDAFNPTESTPADVVDQRSDTYSLGVVLFELLTGELPFPAPCVTAEIGDALRGIAAARRSESWWPVQRDWPPARPVRQVIRRCLEPDPSQRYQTACELARALQACGELRRVERELPAAGPLTQAALRRPFLMLAFLTLLPHFLGSVVNISYNDLRIVNSLTEAQQTAFAWSVLAYNLLMYPVCLAILVALIVPAWRMLRDLKLGRTIRPEQKSIVRRGMLRWPMWAVAVSCLGWLPGGILFPLAIGWFAEPVGLDVFGHFVVSFTVSGLIALTYSYFAVQFVVLRVFYCRLWPDGEESGAVTRAELGPKASQLRWFQVLAGVIPLLAAVLMVGVGPETSGYRTFRLLVTALLVLGMVGFGLATMAHNILSQTLAVLIRGDGRPQALGASHLRSQAAALPLHPTEKE
jgi:hypothetical protein